MVRHRCLSLSHRRVSGSCCCFFVYVHASVCLCVCVCVLVGCGGTGGTRPLMRARASPVVASSSFCSHLLCAASAVVRAAQTGEGPRPISTTTASRSLFPLPVFMPRVAECTGRRERAAECGGRGWSGGAGLMSPRTRTATRVCTLEWRRHAQQHIPKCTKDFKETTELANAHLASYALTRVEIENSLTARRTTSLSPDVAVVDLRCERLMGVCISAR